MNLTQAQVRHLVDITEEQFRSWRNAFVPLKGRSGQSPQFSQGDVLALLIIAELVETYGAKVSKLGAVSVQLFEKCDQLIRADDRVSFLVITSDLVRVIDTEALHTIEALSFIVPFRIIRAKMEAAILSATQVDQQLSLIGI